MEHKDNAALDTVKIDDHGERDLRTAERLLTAEQNRTAGTKGYTVDEFTKNMKEAIVRGAAQCGERDNLKSCYTRLKIDKP